MLRKIISLFLNRGLSSAVQFLALILIGQVLGVAVLGAVSAVTYTSVFLGTMVAWGLPQYGMRMCASADGRLDDAQRAVFRGILRFCFLSMAVFGLVSVAVTASGLVASWAFSPTHLILLVCILIYAPFKIYVEIAKVLGLANKALFLEFAFPYLIMSLCVPVASVLPDAATLLLSAGYATGLIVGLLVLHRDLGRSGAAARDGSDVAPITFAGLPELTKLVLVQFGMQGLVAMPVILAATFLGNTEAGYAAAIMKLAGLTYTVSSAVSAIFGQSLYSAFRKDDFPTIKRLYFAIAALDATANITVMAFIIVTAGWLLQLMGLNDTEAMTVAPILQLVCGIMAARSLLGAPFMFLVGFQRTELEIAGLVLGICVFATLVASRGLAMETAVLGSVLGQATRSLWGAVNALWLIRKRASLSPAP